MATDPEKRYALEEWLQTATPEGIFASYARAFVSKWVQSLKLRATHSIEDVQIRRRSSSPGG